MNAPFYISPRVINTIQGLPEDDRLALATAIVGELLLGVSAKESLTPIQSLAYEIIRSYVTHDTNRIENAAC